MEPENKKRKMRLISGRPELVDAQVNELLDTYSLMTLSYSVVGDHVEVTAWLILQSEVRMMQLANPGPMPGRGH
jgi:hypothetical protein